MKNNNDLVYIIFMTFQPAHTRTSNQVSVTSYIDRYEKIWF